MLDNLRVCCNVVLPVMLMVALGYGLRRGGMINENFIQCGVRLVFSVFFPCSIFGSFGTLNLEEIFDLRLLVFMVSVVLLSALIPMVVVPRFVKNPSVAATMAQSIFRTNVLVQGIPLLTNIYGEENIAEGAFLLPFVVLVNNVMATVNFVVLVPEQKESGGKAVLSALKKVAQNPLIISSALGLLFSAFHWRLPSFAQNTVTQIGRIASPLALVCMGAELRFDTIRQGLRYTIPTVFARLVLVPLAATLAGIALGFRGIALGAVFLFTSTCCATAGYVMAGSMGGDSELSAQCICLSVVLSAFTVTAGLFLLLQRGLI